MRSSESSNIVDLLRLVISIFAGVYATERILVSLDEPSLGANLASAAVFLSFGANFVSTLLIAIKARWARRSRVVGAY